MGHVKIILDSNGIAIYNITNGGYQGWEGAKDCSRLFNFGEKNYLGSKTIVLINAFHPKQQIQLQYFSQVSANENKYWELTNACFGA